MVNCINLIIEMSPRFILGRENVPCVAKVVNRSLKADCTDYTFNFLIFYPYISATEMHVPQPLEHSENKIITYFKKEVEPGVICRNFTQKGQNRHNQRHMLCAFGILAALEFVERCSGALQVRSRF